MGGCLDEGGGCAGGEDAGLQDGVEGVVWLEGHDHAVEALGHEEVGVHGVEEGVAPGARLDFLRCSADSLHGDGHAHRDGVGDEADGELWFFISTCPERHKSTIRGGQALPGWQGSPDSRTERSRVSSAMLVSLRRAVLLSRNFSATLKALYALI